jgi:protease II
MKATLEFSIPEEQHEHQVALDGWKWKAVVSEIAESIRSHLKHDDDLHDEAAKALYNLRNEIFRNIEDRGLELYE